MKTYIYLFIYLKWHVLRPLGIKQTSDMTF